MQNEILHKLKVLLAEPIERESEVVYLLVEIRKFLDHMDGPNPKARTLPVLRMYCDWVVHIFLDRPGKGGMPVLETMDAHLAADPKRKFDEIFQKAAFIFSFRRFKDEMRKFLQDNGLPPELVDELNPAPWGRFLQLYQSIVSECPLLFKAKTFKCIKTATLVAQGLPEWAHAPNWRSIAWQWRFELKDGTTKTHGWTTGFTTEDHRKKTTA